MEVAKNYIQPTLDFKNYITSLDVVGHQMWYIIILMSPHIANFT